MSRFYSLLKIKPIIDVIMEFWRDLDILLCFVLVWFGFKSNKSMGLVYLVITTEFGHRVLQRLGALPYPQCLCFLQDI